MTDTPQRASVPPTRAKSADNTLMRKLAAIAMIAAATLVPAMLISDLTAQREASLQSVRQEFAKLWGPAQTLAGPTLIIPYQHSGWQRRGYVEVQIANLDVAAKLIPQQRKRGLFQATVYDAEIDMSSAFAVPAEVALREVITDKDAQILWQEAHILVGTTPGKVSARGADRATIAGVETAWAYCSELAPLAGVCQNDGILAVRAPLAATGAPAQLSFQTKLALRGTDAFALAFSGRQLSATIVSAWPSPSFSGDMLPAQSKVTRSGFEASWALTRLGLPRIANVHAALQPSATQLTQLGVSLIEPVTHYRMIERVAKYALLFVVLSFACYFFFEVLARLEIHVVQYGLLGVSLSLFSLLLLSLAEPLGYAGGYAISAAMVLLQATLYTASVTRSIKSALGFGAMLASLFGLLYVLLSLEPTRCCLAPCSCSPCCRC